MPVSDTYLVAQPHHFVKELQAVKALNLLFYNYRNDDIKNISGASNDFAHDWVERISCSPDTFVVMWECYAGRWSRETCAVVLAYALDKYGDEAHRWLYRI